MWEDRQVVAHNDVTPANILFGEGPWVIVIDLDRNGLAFEHGFKIGDIILDVGGKKVVTPVDVRNAVRDAHKDGKRVVLMRLKSDETTKFVAVPFARA